MRPHAFTSSNARIRADRVFLQSRSARTRKAIENRDLEHGRSDSLQLLLGRGSIGFDFAVEKIPRESFGSAEGRI